MFNFNKFFMAGHSKWSNIKHRKQSNDLKKSKLFSKLANDIRSSVVDSKNDINSNLKLKKAIDKALANNMSKNVINNIISNLDQHSNIKHIYSAIGDNGSSIIIECLDNNKNRIIGELRCILNQNNMTLVPFKSIEYTYLKIDKISLFENYNDRILFCIAYNIVLNSVSDNCLYLDNDYSKKIIHLLKDLDIKNEPSQIFHSKNTIYLDSIMSNKLLNIILELKKLQYVSNVFYNFK